MNFWNFDFFFKIFFSSSLPLISLESWLYAIVQFAILLSLTIKKSEKNLYFGWEMIILQKHGAWHQSEFFPLRALDSLATSTEDHFWNWLLEEDFLTLEVNAHSGPAKWNWLQILSYVHSNTEGLAILKSVKLDPLTVEISTPSLRVSISKPV